MNLAAAAIGDREELKASMGQILRRVGFHQNFLRGTDDPERRWKCPDILTPHQLSVTIRGLRWWWAYPLLYVLDLAFLADLILRRRQTWDYDNMLAQNFFFAVIRYPTFIGVLAYSIYENTDFLERIDNYYAAENNGIPPMAELYRWAFHKTRGKLWSASSFSHWFSLR